MKTEYRLQVGTFEDEDFTNWASRAGFKITRGVKSRRTCIRCAKEFGYLLKRGVSDRRTCQKCIQLPSYKNRQPEGI